MYEDMVEGQSSQHVADASHDAKRALHTRIFMESYAGQESLKQNLPRSLRYAAVARLFGFVGLATLGYWAGLHEGILWISVALSLVSCKCCDTFQIVVVVSIQWWLVHRASVVQSVSARLAVLPPARDRDHVEVLPAIVAVVRLLIV